MKRKTFSFLFCLICISTNLIAVSYFANIGVSNGASFAFVKDDEVIRTRYYAKADVEVLSLKIGKNSFSVPLSVSYFSESVEYNYFYLRNNLDFALGLSYRHSFTQLFSLRAEILAAYRYYPKIIASQVALKVGTSFEFYPAKMVAIAIPIEVSILKGEIDLNAGIGLMLHFGG